MSYTVTVLTKEGGRSDTGEVEYDWIFQIVSTAINDDPSDVDVAVVAAYPQAAWGAAYSVGNPCRCRTKRAKQTHELHIWEETVHWSDKTSVTDRGTITPTSTGLGAGTAPATSGQNIAGTAPSSRPWKVTWGAVNNQVHVMTDRAGLAICSSAGQPYADGLVVDNIDTLLTVTWYSATVNPENIITYQGKVNDTAMFNGLFGVKTCRCNKLAQTSVFENGAFYWENTVEFQYRREKWIPTYVLDCGTVRSVNSIVPPIPILDSR